MLLYEIWRIFLSSSVISGVSEKNWGMWAGLKRIWCFGIRQRRRGLGAWNRVLSFMRVSSVAVGCVVDGDYRRVRAGGVSVRGSQKCWKEGRG